jgi:pilus assembly protein CpaE
VPAGGQGEISRKDFESSIERKIDLVVPFDQKLAAQAAKLGKPFAEAGKGAKSAQPLLSLCARLLSTAEEMADSDEGTKEQCASKSQLGKLGDFKALMPAKPNMKK